MNLEIDLSRALYTSTDIYNKVMAQANCTQDEFDEIMNFHNSQDEIEFDRELNNRKRRVNVGLRTKEISADQLSNDFESVNNWIFLLKNQSQFLHETEEVDKSIKDPDANVNSGETVENNALNLYSFQTNLVRQLRKVIETKESPTTARLVELYNNATNNLKLREDIHFRLSRNLDEANKKLIQISTENEELIDMINDLEKKLDNFKDRNNYEEIQKSKKYHIVKYEYEKNKKELKRQIDQAEMEINGYKIKEKTEVKLLIQLRHNEEDASKLIIAYQDKIIQMESDIKSNEASHKQLLLTLEKELKSRRTGQVASEKRQTSDIKKKITTNSSKELSAFKKNSISNSKQIKKDIKKFDGTDEKGVQNAIQYIDDLQETTINFTKEIFDKEIKELRQIVEDEQANIQLECNQLYNEKVSEVMKAKDMEVSNKYRLKGLLNDREIELKSVTQQLEIYEGILADMTKEYKTTKKANKEKKQQLTGAEKQKWENRKLMKASIKNIDYFIDKANFIIDLFKKKLKQQMDKSVSTEYPFETSTDNTKKRSLKVKRSNSMLFGKEKDEKLGINPFVRIKNYKYERDDLRQSVRFEPSFTPKQPSTSTLQAGTSLAKVGRRISKITASPSGSNSNPINRRMSTFVGPRAKISQNNPDIQNKIKKQQSIDLETFQQMNINKNEKDGLSNIKDKIKKQQSVDFRSMKPTTSNNSGESFPTMKPNSNNDGGDSFPTMRPNTSSNDGESFPSMKPNINNNDGESFPSMKPNSSNDADSFPKLSANPSSNDDSKTNNTDLVNAGEGNQKQSQENSIQNAIEDEQKTQNSDSSQNKLSTSSNNTENSIVNEKISQSNSKADENTSNQIMISQSDSKADENSQQNKTSASNSGTENSLNKVENETTESERTIHENETQDEDRDRISDAIEKSNKEEKEDTISDIKTEQEKEANKNDIGHEKESQKDEADKSNSYSKFEQEKISPSNSNKQNSLNDDKINESNSKTDDDSTKQDKITTSNGITGNSTDNKIISPSDSKTDLNTVNNDHINPSSTKTYYNTANNDKISPSNSRTENKTAKKEKISVSNSKTDDNSSKENKISPSNNNATNSIDNETTSNSSSDAAKSPDEANLTKNNAQNSSNQKKISSSNSCSTKTLPTKEIISTSNSKFDGDSSNSNKINPLSSKTINLPKETINPSNSKEDEHTANNEENSPNKISPSNSQPNNSTIAKKLRPSGSKTYENEVYNDEISESNSQTTDDSNQNNGKISQSNRRTDENTDNQDKVSPSNNNTENSLKNEKETKHETSIDNQSQISSMNNDSAVNEIQIQPNNHTEQQDSTITSNDSNQQEKEQNEEISSLSISHDNENDENQIQRHSSDTKKDNEIPTQTETATKHEFNPPQSSIKQPEKEPQIDTPNPTETITPHSSTNSTTLREERSIQPDPLKNEAPILNDEDIKLVRAPMILKGKNTRHRVTLTNKNPTLNENTEKLPNKEESEAKNNNKTEENKNDPLSIIAPPLEEDDLKAKSSQTHKETRNIMPTFDIRVFKSVGGRFINTNLCYDPDEDFIDNKTGKLCHKYRHWNGTSASFDPKLDFYDDSGILHHVYKVNLKEIQKKKKNKMKQQQQPPNENKINNDNVVDVDKVQSNVPPVPIKIIDDSNKKMRHKSVDNVDRSSRRRKRSRFDDSVLPHQNLMPIPNSLGINPTNYRSLRRSNSPSQRFLYNSNGNSQKNTGLVENDESLHVTPISDRFSDSERSQERFTSKNLRVIADQKETLATTPKSARNFRSKKQKETEKNEEEKSTVINDSNEPLLPPLSNKNSNNKQIDQSVTITSTETPLPKVQKVVPSGQENDQFSLTPRKLNFQTRLPNTDSIAENPSPRRMRSPRELNFMRGSLDLSSRKNGRIMDVKTLSPRMRTNNQIANSQPNMISNENNENTK